MISKKLGNGSSKPPGIAPTIVANFAFVRFNMAPFATSTTLGSVPRVMFIDTARTAPFAKNLSQSPPTQETSTGLALIELASAPPRGESSRLRGASSPPRKARSPFTYRSAL